MHDVSNLHAQYVHPVPYTLYVQNVCTISIHNMCMHAQYACSQYNKSEFNVFIM